MNIEFFQRIDSEIAQQSGAPIQGGKRFAKAVTYATDKVVHSRALEAAEAAKAAMKAEAEALEALEAARLDESALVAEASRAGKEAEAARLKWKALEGKALEALEAAKAAKVARLKAAKVAEAANVKAAKAEALEAAEAARLKAAKVAPTKAKAKAKAKAASYSLVVRGGQWAVKSEGKILRIFSSVRDAAAHIEELENPTPAPAPAPAPQELKTIPPLKFHKVEPGHYTWGDDYLILQGSKGWELFVDEVSVGEFSTKREAVAHATELHAS